MVICLTDFLVSLFYVTVLVRHSIVTSYVRDDVKYGPICATLCISDFGSACMARRVARRVGTACNVTSCSGTLLRVETFGPFSHTFLS